MKRTILATAIAAFATSANAAEFNNYFTLGSAHTDIEDSTEYFEEYSTHAYTAELAIGNMLSENTAIEASLTLPNYQRKDRAEVEQARVNGFYFLSTGSIKPYVTGGIGFGRVNIEDQSNPTLSVGLGLEVDFTDRFFGRIETRMDDMINEHAEFYSYGLELGMRFGKKSMPAAPAPVVEEPVVEPEPAPAVVVEPPKPVDADNDGIMDDMDKCLGTPADVTVDEKGCPDFKGKLQGVNFQSGSANLTASSRVVLNDAATELKRYPELTIMIAAHSDSSGSDELNLKLSQKRAESVLEYLVGQGVAADKLTAKGYGEASPIASNETKEGRAKNRRVELVVQ